MVTSYSPVVGWAVLVVDNGNGDNALGAIDGRNTLSISISNIRLSIVLNRLAEFLNFLINSVALQIRCRLTKMIQLECLVGLGVQEPVFLDKTMLRDNHLLYDFARRKEKS